MLRLAVVQQLNLHQPLRFLHRQRAERHGVQHLVDGGVGADAERQRHHGGGCEPWGSAQLAERVSQVLREGVQEWQPALFAVGLLDLRDAAKLPPRRAPRLVGWHSGRDVGFGEHLQMRADFFGHVSLAGLLFEERAQAENDLAELVHG